jgi:hypothetical protein
MSHPKKARLSWILVLVLDRAFVQEGGRLSRNCFVQLIPANRDFRFSRTKDDDEHEYDLLTSESGLNKNVDTSRRNQLGYDGGPPDSGISGHQQ